LVNKSTTIQCLVAEAKSIPFDAFTLAAVAAELRKTIVGARVQKVQQPSETDLILALYGRSGAQRLLLSADPKYFRAHLTQIRRENPVTPPGFCQVCRKYLEGGTVEAVTMPHFDRVLHLEFRTHDGEHALLIAELMGRNSNVVLVSGAGVVRGTLRPVPRDAERSLRTNQPYTSPPGYGEKRDPLEETDTLVLPETSEEIRGYLADFSGIGRFGAEEMVVRGQEGFASLIADVREERFAPHSAGTAEGKTVGVWAFAPLTFPVGLRFPRESISVALDTYYATLTSNTQEAGERTTLQRLITREKAYREKELTSARNTLAEAGRAEEYERAGNNLLAQLGLIERGAPSVTIADLYDPEGAEVTLTLDPKLGAHDNAEAYFTRARKARDAAEHATLRAEAREDELAQLRLLELDMERGETPERIQERLEEIIGMERAKPDSAPSARKREERPFQGHKIRKTTVDGYELLYGENAEANDYLTTRVAAPTDLWMHVRSAPGAHGVLRTNGKPDRVPDEVVRHAAAIIAARSGTSIKHATLVAVDVVEKRYVRKPRGAKPGMVTIERERVVDVSPSLG
jgi:predicted ribosome quality control (RQC) complex YloA/Tae2 family protein